VLLIAVLRSGGVGGDPGSGVSRGLR
jgi:hypothetical protein